MTVESASVAAEAQVHATLALAAATALAVAVPIIDVNCPAAAREWVNAIEVVDED